ncbi:MAG: hypothetical protein LUG98_14325 [Tannerellaceae bacterium]|nr:hypothetical protein [Tannerellaceae bacterium]
MKTNELYQTVLSKLGHIKDEEEKLSRVYILLEEMEAGTPDEEIVSVDVHNREEYRELVMEIADALNEEFICFVNPETLEFEQVDCKAWFNPEEIAEQNEDMLDEYLLDYIKWDDYIRLDPFNREDLRRVMEKFAEDIDDPKLAKTLQNYLEEDRPLRYMLQKIRDAEKEDVWNVFKKQEIINYVKGELAETELPQ